MATRRLKPNPNDRLLDASVRRSVFVRRFGAGLVHDVVARLNERVIERAMARVESGIRRIRRRGQGSRAWQLKSYRTMMQRVRRSLRTGLAEVREQLGRQLQQLGRNEADWMRRTTERVTGESANAPKARDIRSGLVFGQRLGEQIAELERQALTAIERQVRLGLQQAETDAQIMRRLRGTARQGHRDGVMETTRRGARRIVLTGVTNTSSEAREAVVGANEDELTGVQWVAILDARTSMICAGLHGSVFPRNKGPRPPAHPNCRSVVVPVHRGDAPARTTSYPEWLRRQSKAVQNDILGPTRARMWRAGRVAIREFTDDRQRTLTLDQLEDLIRRQDEAA